MYFSQSDNNAVYDSTIRVYKSYDMISNSNMYF